VACAWTPDSDLADDAGNVKTEFVWAALDCPTGFACYQGGRPLVLARLSGTISQPVKAGEAHIVHAWSQGDASTMPHAPSQSRTYECSVSRALWIELKDPASFDAHTSSSHTQVSCRTAMQHGLVK
jgi:hypothetical protein